METRLILVTPEMAKDILKTNAHNRAVREGHVSFLAREISAGRFDYKNGESLKVDTSGRLIDGQHRLLAVIRAGKQQVLPFVTVAEDAVKTIDMGLRRSSSDTFVMMNDLKMAQRCRTYPGGMAQMEAYYQRRITRYCSVITSLEIEGFVELVGKKNMEGYMQEGSDLRNVKPRYLLTAFWLWLFWRLDSAGVERGTSRGFARDLFDSSRQCEGAVSWARKYLIGRLSSRGSVTSLESMNVVLITARDVLLLGDTKARYRTEQGFKRCVVSLAKGWVGLARVFEVLS